MGEVVNHRPAAARRVHRRIELHARSSAALGGLVAEIDEETYDLDRSERDGGGVRAVGAEQLWRNFLASRFATMNPLMTEQPFTLHLQDGLTVTGRIDAIFEDENGAWQVVDFKTGAREPDPLQLALYRRAVQEIWSRQARCSWLLLQTGEEKPAPTVADFDAIVDTVASELAALAVDGTEVEQKR